MRRFSIIIVLLAGAFYYLASGTADKTGENEPAGNDASLFAIQSDNNRRFECRDSDCTLACCAGRDLSDQIQITLPQTVGFSRIGRRPIRND
jgi:hypothetical protein